MAFVIFPSSPPVCSISWVFSLFFKILLFFIRTEYWSVILLNLNKKKHLNLGLSGVFLCWSEVMHFWQEYYKRDMSFSVHYIKCFFVSKCLITGDVYLDHLIQLGSAKFLHYWITCFAFVVKYPGEDNLDYGNWFLLKHLPINFHIH